MNVCSDRRTLLPVLLWLHVALVGCATTASSPPAVEPTRPTATAPLAATSPRWADGRVFYEIFVRSFKDSDGDGIGDFRGLTASLDYLNDGKGAAGRSLGVEGVWLMPVFASPSYHGYDTIDYYRVNPQYGTNEDFAQFCREARRRGIKVIVDLVLNHSSDQHPWFRESASGPENPRRDWYVWRRDNPGWTQPWGGGPTWHARGDWFYYGLFWGGMPDLNQRNPAVRDEFRKIAKFWLDLGVDGFRLDAARHIVEGEGQDGQFDTPETLAFWRDFAAYVRSIRPDALLVGENWTSTDRIAKYFGEATAIRGGDALPLNFNFPLASAIVEGVKGGEAGRIAAVIEEMRARYPEGAMDAPFLTNHDMPRIATILENDRARLGLAASVLLSLPGTPFLYYGEEVGILNGPSRRDEDKRTPMPWDGSLGGGFTTGTPWHPFAPGRDVANVEFQDGVRDSLLNRYRALVQLRARTPALRSGDLTLLDVHEERQSVLAFIRREELPGRKASEADRVIVLHNFSGVPVSVRDIPLMGAGLEPLFTDQGTGSATRAVGGWHFLLPPRGTAIYRITPG